MRYDKSIFEVNMSCPTKTQNDITKDSKLSPSREVPNFDNFNKSTGTPPLPMIPDDDVDDGDEGFPLITSVFSLASPKEGEKDDSLDPQISPKKEPAAKTLSKNTSPVATVSTSTSPQGNAGNIPPQTVRMLTPNKTKSAVDTKSGPDRDNAPYYVGKGKLILPKPKPEDSKIQGSSPQSAMAFSKMTSINPQNNGNTFTVKSTASVNKETPGSTSGMMTRSASHKMNSSTNDHHRTISPGGATSSGSNASVTQSTSLSNIAKLSNTVQIINVKGTQSQSVIPPLAPMSTSVFGSSSPIAQLIKRITPSPAVTTVNQAPGPIITSSTPATLVTSVAPSSVQVRSTRHVNIAPAPTVNTAVNTTRYVMLAKTVTSTVTIPATQVVSSKGGVNLPRVVMVPKGQVNSQGAGQPKTQVLYVIGNPATAGDGKTYRLLFPEKKVSPGATATQIPSNIVSTNNGNTIPSSQLVRIIPKPSGTTVVHQQPRVPLETQSSTTTVVTSNVNTVAPILNTGSTTILQPDGTSTFLSTTSGTAPSALFEDSMTTALSASSPSTEEVKSSEESIDTGLSPHEARIQKLKELLRKQEEAVDRLREKRQKEIDDVRAPPVDGSNEETATATKRDSPFIVPLPPKKARLEHYRTKQKEASPTVKDGFLPNTDDTQFVKLVGLEKVVDKLKAKKLLELKESHSN